LAGVKAYDRDSYLEDIKTHLRRGHTVARTAMELGLSERTVYRILGEHRAGR
jgi:AraC-like DNA-binding protein